MTSFLSLGVPENLAAVLAADGKTEPFAIQRDTLPDSLAGRDVLGRGRTGSGKTIAFALPLVAKLEGGRRRANHPRGLVLAPTRELASQIASTIRPLADAAGLTVTTIFGGVSQRPQEQALSRGVDIVVACPGRLEDLMKQGHVRLDAVEIAVLDEADHMADLGFLPGVTRILTATPRGGQRLLFSATLDRGVDSLVKRFLSNQVLHEVDEESVPQGVMTHRVFVTSADDKPALVRSLASGHGRRILFTRTKHQAKNLARKLTASGIPAVDLHGNLSQNARERNLAAFGADADAGGVRVLVATDVAARGVHVDNVELVVHVDPPVEHKAYLHRSGRTARAGAAGIVVTVATDSQRGEVKDLLRLAKVSAALEPVHSEHAAVAELVGAAAPHVTPAPLAPQQRQAPRKKAPAGDGGSRRGGGRPSSASRQDVRSGEPDRSDRPARSGRPAGQRGQGSSQRGQGSGERSQVSGDRAPQRAGAAGGQRSGQAAGQGSGRKNGRSGSQSGTPRTGTSAAQRFTTGATVSDISRGNRTPNRRARG